MPAAWIRSTIVRPSDWTWLSWPAAAMDAERWCAIAESLVSTRRGAKPTAARSALIIATRVVAAAAGLRSAASTVVIIVRVVAAAGGTAGPAGTTSAPRAMTKAKASGARAARKWAGRGVRMQRKAQWYDGAAGPVRPLDVSDRCSVDAAGGSARPPLG